MTHFTARNLNQTAVYWGNPQPDGYGSYTYDDPVEINCRWEDVAMTNIAAMGINADIRSEVFLDQDVDEEGMLLLGELTDLDSDGYNDPLAAGAHMIVRFDKIPTMKADFFFRKVYLGRLWTGKA